MHYEPDRGTGPDGDGRLDLKIAGRDLVASARHILLRRLTDRLDKIVKRRSKGTPDRRRRGTPFSDNMMLVC